MVANTGEDIHLKPINLKNSRTNRSINFVTDFFSYRTVTNRASLVAVTTTGFLKKNFRKMEKYRFCDPSVDKAVIENGWMVGKI